MVSLASVSRNEILPLRILLMPYRSQLSIWTVTWTMRLTIRGTGNGVEPGYEQEMEGGSSPETSSRGGFARGVGRLQDLSCQPLA